MANRSTVLLNAATVTGAGVGFLCDLVRNQEGCFTVEYAGTLGTLTVVLEGRAVPGTGEWLQITSLAHGSFPAGYKGMASAVTLMPEMRANCTVFTGITSVTAKLIQ